jgi:hypothetical protein
VVVGTSNFAGHLGPGEALLTVTDGQYASFSGQSDAQAYVNSVTGKVPSGDRAVMVDDAGNVVSVHRADMALAAVSLSLVAGGGTGKFEKKTSSKGSRRFAERPLHRACW